MWRPEGKIRLVDLDNYVFLAFFELSQDYNSALLGGPWMILDHYLVVHSWDPSFRITPNLPPRMVVWVRFPKLPYQYYQKDILTGLGNLVGRFVRIDTPTLNSARGKFARIAVEINVAEPVATGVFLDGVWQEVEYENLPSFCFELRRSSPRVGFGPWLTVQRKAWGVKKVSPIPAFSDGDLQDAKKGKSKIQVGRRTDRVKVAVGSDVSLVNNLGKKNKKGGTKDGKVNLSTSGPSKKSSSPISVATHGLSLAHVNSVHAEIAPGGSVSKAATASLLTNCELDLAHQASSSNPLQTSISVCGLSPNPSPTNGSVGLAQQEEIKLHVSSSSPTGVLSLPSQSSVQLGGNLTGGFNGDVAPSPTLSTANRTKRKGGVAAIPSLHSSALRGVVQMSTKPEIRIRGGKQPQKLIDIVNMVGISPSRVKKNRQQLSPSTTTLDVSMDDGTPGCDQACFNLNQSHPTTKFRDPTTLDGLISGSEKEDSYDE
ncbi:hypothetical protein LINGRAHAP2_LOCUS14200 [Linum grandiflorum]